MILHETPFKARVWAKFRQYHYTPDRWTSSAQVFVATEIFDGKEVIVGMSAALPAPQIPNGRCSHKVVVLPPSTLSTVWASSEKILLPDFDKNQMWRAIADAQAAMFVNAGYRYYCNASDAPSDLIAYRDDPASGWMPTVKNGKPPRDKGHGPRYNNKPRCTNAAGLVVSHEYVGLPAPEAPAAQPVTEALVAGDDHSEIFRKDYFCQGLVKDGKPCTARKVKGDFCQTHHPELHAESVARRKQKDFEFRVQEACRKVQNTIRIGYAGTYPPLEERRQMFHKVCERFKITFEDLVRIHYDHFASPEQMAILREAAGLPPAPTKDGAGAA